MFSVFHYLGSILSYALRVTFHLILQMKNYATTPNIEKIKWIEIIITCRVMIFKHVLLLLLFFSNILYSNSVSRITAGVSCPCTATYGLKLPLKFQNYTLHFIAGCIKSVHYRYHLNQLCLQQNN